MDRLLCGDVCRGKTEVAARAIFKCAAEGKQAAVLGKRRSASQHYHTLSIREIFKVEMMLVTSRTPAEQKK